MPSTDPAPQQLAPRDVAGPVLVDQLVLELTRALAVRVELLAGVTRIEPPPSSAPGRGALRRRVR